MRKIFEKGEKKEETEKVKEDGRTRKDREWQEIVKKNEKERNEIGPARLRTTEPARLPALDKELWLEKKGGEKDAIESEENARERIVRKIGGREKELRKKETKKSKLQASVGNLRKDICDEISNVGWKRRPYVPSYCRLNLDPEGMTIDL